MLEAPQGFRIRKAILNKKKIKLKDKRVLSLEPEGEYAIHCKAKKTGEVYDLLITVDHTPPVIVFSGIDEDGIARKGNVGIVSYNKSDTIEVYHNGKEIAFNPDGFYETGTYLLEVMDIAENRNTYEFTINVYHKYSVWNLMVIFSAIFFSVIGYLIHERRRFRVR